MMEKRVIAIFDTAANKAHCERLEELGQEVLRLPPPGWLTRSATVSDGEMLQQAAEGDLVIFNDARAAAAFGEFAEEFGFDVFELDNVAICALGEAVADQLRFLQIHADLVPRELSPDTVVREIAGYVAAGSLSGKRILIVYASMEPSELADGLEAGGARLSILRVAAPEDLQLARAKALIVGGEPDLFFLSSAFDLEDLFVFSRSIGMPDMLDRSLIVCADESTLAIAAERGVIGTPAF